MKTQSTIIVAALSVALLAAACESGNLSGELEFDEPVELVVTHVDASNLVLTAADGPARVVWDIDYHHTFGEPSITSWVKDGALHVDMECDGDCRGEIAVTVPADVDVVADTGAGSIHLDGITGNLDAVVGSGSIEGRALECDEVLADTGSGSVELQLAAMPSIVDVEAGSGSVDLQVPYGVYAIDVSAGDGSTVVENLIDDPAAPNQITARAGSGNVHVTGY